MSEEHRVFLIIATILLLVLPFLTALYIYYIHPELIYFSLLSLALMISFFIGLRDEQEKPRMHTKTLITGLIMSVLQLILLHSRVQNLIYLTAFPLYLWAWLAMYSTGLQIRPENIDVEAILSALITSLAGLGTLSWLWLSILKI